MSEQNILEVKDLTKHFKAGKKQLVHAVDGISFTLERGKTLGLVGESGCGKSSCARTIIRMYDPTAGTSLRKGLLSSAGASGYNRKHREWCPSPT